MFLGAASGSGASKPRLASGLSATVPPTHTQVTGQDSMLELGVKVLGNTVSANLQVRDPLNRDALARAIELLAGADTARASGATLVPITASQSPLARRADVALIIDQVQDATTQVPMISRLLHLLVIDILAVGVATLPQAAAASLDENQGAPPTVKAKPAGLGISAASTLAQLTSHSR